MLPVNKVAVKQTAALANDESVFFIIIGYAGIQI